MIYTVLGSLLPLRFVAKAKKRLAYSKKINFRDNTIFIEFFYFKSKNISFEKEIIEKNIFKGSKLVTFPRGTTSRWFNSFKF